MNTKRDTKVTSRPATHIHRPVTDTTMHPPPHCASANISHMNQGIIASVDALPLITPAIPASSILSNLAITEAYQYLLRFILQPGFGKGLG